MCLMNIMQLDKEDFFLSDRMTLNDIYFLLHYMQLSLNAVGCCVTGEAAVWSF